VKAPPDRPTPERLARRLDEVASVLEASSRGLGLLALGSGGLERERLDAWSDLDFFVLVAPGAKAGFLDQPAWLSGPAPVAWLFRNTVDGFKVLWADGLFAELAVFELAELARIPFAPGRVVWAAPGLDLTCLEPRTAAGRSEALPGEAWAREELLSGLYVGLARFGRGEKLSAWRHVQGHCLQRFLELVQLTRPPAPGRVDPFDPLRRFEVRFPAEAALLPALLGGYEATPRAARALLDWLLATGPVNPALGAQVLSLIEAVSSSVQGQGGPAGALHAVRDPGEQLQALAPVVQPAPVGPQAEVEARPGAGHPDLLDRPLGVDDHLLP
jgi:hypothetical protein